MPLSSLNREQREAAEAPLGANLVIASAGTGKTSTIVGRIAHLLQNGVDPETILLLTFTNKAAQEMIARLGRYFAMDVLQKIEAGTFHAVAYRWLRQEDKALVLKQPSQLRTLFRSIYQSRQFHRFLEDIPPYSASYLYDRYGLWQNGSNEPFDEWFLKEHPEHEPYIDAYVDIIREYEEQKHKHRFLSFNDLLLRAIELVEQKPKRFTEVLVDEYQDTNALQSRLIDAIATESLFCVGDYDQSIYAFNGADIRNIATFKQRYANAKIFSLGINYRSGSAILSLADRVIRNNERLYPKHLEVGKKSKAFLPKLLVYNDLYEQYRSIAHHIKQLHVTYDSIAVLFRNNASADGIEAGLRQVGVACRRKGSTSFFETKEIKFLLDFISLCLNEKDMMAVINVFEYAPGFGTALAKEMFEQFVFLGEGSFCAGVCDPARETLLQRKKRTSRQLALFEEELEEASIHRFSPIDITKQLRSHPILKHPKLTQESVLYLDRFFKVYTKLAHARSRPTDFLKALLGSELWRFIAEMLASERARAKNGEVDEEKKQQALERIERKARLLLELSKPYKELERFVNAMVLGGGELSEGEGVNLLTVHASKGLEFEAVFVVDLVEGRFPNHKMMTSVEEERRLFYVAVTRAKTYLFLSYAKYDSLKKRSYEPSRFLKEAGLV